MKAVWTAAVSLVALTLATAPAHAFGHRRGRCATPCDWMAECAPAAYGPGMAVSWVEQTVTAYRPEVRTRTVNRTIQRPVTREVPE